MRNKDCIGVNPFTIENFQFQNQFNGFAKRISDQGKSRSYYQSITAHVREFLHFMEQQGVSHTREIKQLHIENYVHYLEYRPNLRKPGGLSLAYLNKQREAVLRFMEYCKNTGIGASGFYIPYRTAASGLKDILTRQEIVLLYEATDNTLRGMTDRAILSLLYGCGLRRGELHDLEVNDIDLSTALIRLDKTKTKHQRDVVMSPKVQAYLEEYLYHAREIMLPLFSNESHVLVTGKGQRMSIHTIPWRIRQLAEKAGIRKNITPHTLRHSIATHLMEELSLEEVAAFLGHQHLDATQIYTHLSAEEHDFKKVYLYEKIHETPAKPGIPPQHH